jgi:hypothetical protein
MTEVEDSGEVENAQVHNLAAAAAELLDRAATSPAGRAALTLVAGAGAPLKQTVLASAVACSWPSTKRPGRPRSKSCMAGCGW